METNFFNNQLKVQSGHLVPRLHSQNPYGKVAFLLHYPLKLQLLRTGLSQILIEQSSPVKGKTHSHPFSSKQIPFGLEHLFGQISVISAQFFPMNPCLH